jgi:hypothetical protein
VVSSPFRHCFHDPPGHRGPGRRRGVCVVCLTLLARPIGLGILGECEEWWTPASSARVCLLLGTVGVPSQREEILSPEAEISRKRLALPARGPLASPAGRGTSTCLSVVASTIDLRLLAWPAAHHIASNGATWGQTGPMRGGGYAASYDGTGHDSHCQHGRGSMRYVSSRGEEGWARETQARQQTVSSYCE